jgi:hypothetical protein
LVIVLAGLYALTVEPYWIEVTHPTLHARGVSPPLRVLHLTDLHGASLGRREKSVLRIIQEEKPDLIVMTGDTSDRGSFGSYREFLASLHAPLGVFAVKGNWEHWAPAADEATTYESAGITLLVDEARRLRDGLWIVGFDDETAGAPDVDRAMRSVPSGVATIALMHSPSLFDRVAPRVSVAFAGHTHGGQVRVPFLPPLWVPPGSGTYVSGSYERNGTPLYVSRGIGTSVLPIRFACRPELPVVTVTP